jgi:alpha-aminoadipate/glutamate carrier protein LysW
MSELKHVCLVCESEVKISTEVLHNELISCTSCGADLVVNKSEDDIKLTLAPEVEEDWGE